MIVYRSDCASKASLKSRLSHVTVTSTLIALLNAVLCHRLHYLLTSLMHA
jgi:hypothetical protein